MMDKANADAAGIDTEAIQQVAVNLIKTGDLDKYTSMLDDMFAKMKAVSPEQYTFNPGLDLFMNPLYEQITEGIVIRKDGSSTNFEREIDIPEFKHQIVKLNEWYSKGYIRNDIATATSTLSSNEEKAKVAIVTTTWKPGQDTGMIPQYGYTEPAYIFTENPYMQRNSALLTMTSVGANSKHPINAWKIHRYF